MNRYTAGSVLVALAVGYFVGWGHGNDVAVVDARPAERTVYLPSPHASVCADMLEAAWSVEDAATPVLPHNP